MQCSSCGARNKDEAKFCAECGKPLVSGSDEEQIDRLVEWLVHYDLDEPASEDAKRRLRDAAREVHAKWKANPHIEDVELKIEADDIDDSFDAEDLAEIFSGREAAERAEDEKREREEEAREQREAAER